MSTYEIDDEVVRGLVDNRDLLPPRLLTAVAALEEQIPLPAPTGLGAVVRAEEGVFVLADPEADLCWARPVGRQESPDWMTAAQIGRIVEVLSEGVDQPDAGQVVERVKPRCPSCGSPRWVSVSLDGGWTRRAQCVPCGAYHAPVIGPGWKARNFRDPEAEHPDYREKP